MVDLGMHPLCQSFLTAEELEQMEPFYPLEVRVCPNCHLAQIGDHVAPEVIFDDYAYYSSYSTAWLEHARKYAEMMTERFGLTTGSKVLEIASNDGYLLQYFRDMGFEVLGVEPSANVAAAAAERGIESLVEFFNESLGRRLRKDGFRANVIVANNVLAHTPYINDFVAGVPQVLADDGVATFEFPHLMRLIEGNQFDTIYHEHWSYLSLGTTQKIFAAHGMRVFDVEELWTHGGSLRLFVRHDSDESHPVTPRVAELTAREEEFGLFKEDVYRQFDNQVRATKRKLLSLLIAAKDEGASIVAYGAAGKGNTLLNYCGIGTDFIDYGCDRNPYKQGRFAPGTHIPIVSPDRIRETRPDYVLLLPWNLKEELMEQLSYISEWGGRFIIPIPEAQIVEGGAT
jgi:SAM-dependent methyltransferase